VTILPPSADDVLSPLRAQVDDLSRLLAAPDGETGDAVLLKQRIFLAHRSVVQHAQLIDALQDEVRRLVDGWKARFASGGATAPSVNEAPPGTAPPAVESPAAAIPVTDAAADAVVGTPSLEVEFPAMPSVRTDGGRLTPISAARLTPVGAGRHTPSITLTPSRSHAPSPAHGQPRVIDELNASTFVERGWSKIASGDFEGAEVALDRALELNPGDPQAETLLGWARMSQGKLDAAMELFEQVLDRAPDHALAHINVGYVHMRRGQHDVAIEHLTYAIGLDSDRKATLYAHFYLGLVHFEREHYDTAVVALLRAIELGPNLIEARFVLGRVYWFAGRADDAIAAWRKGAEVNKFNPWSARCREMLATVADGGAPSRVA
jgi:tetratricopeptide (TPR) repeat protein